MYEVTTEKSFDAAHYLRDYKGKCANLHGHRWTVKVRCVAVKLTDGMVIDFTTVKAFLNPIIERYDHQCLNDIQPYDVINPTAENIARHIYIELSHYIMIDSVEVFESPTSSAKYWVD